MPERVVIIGSGPAGWTAAIYAARASLEPLVFEGAVSEENRLQGTMPLGQLALTFNEMMNRLENSFDQMRQFSSDASHELRTPLTQVKGYADLFNRTS